MNTLKALFAALATGAKRNKLILIIAAAIIATGALSIKSAFGPKLNDPRAASVMITNRAGNHGGTGAILLSLPTESTIITNAHVCAIAVEGAIVKTRNAEYQVSSYKISLRSDLCLITVAADLGVQTEITSIPPKMYDRMLISGHPALLPNVVTEGHFSGRRIIQVMTGFKKCSEEDLAGPDGVMCAFFGGIPQVKSYESVLVSATIMPGSSGSGVYDSTNRIAGLVFAGSGDLAYGWTVPYEQVVNFVNNEAPKMVASLPNPLVALGGGAASKLSNQEIQNKCGKLRMLGSLAEGSDAANNPDFKKLSEVCDLVGKDYLWTK